MEASIGSISSGTMREQDLIPCFLDELRRLDDTGKYPGTIGEIQKRLDECGAWADENESRWGDAPYWDEYAAYDLENLFEALNQFSPPYCYFGAHEGDGADYGFWVSFDALDDAVRDEEILKVDDLSEMPEDYRGEIVQVNDHGNTSLYVQDDNGLREIWAVV